MLGFTSSLCTFEELDSQAMPAPLRFAQWRETGLLPMIAEPADDEGRERFRIRVNKLAGSAGRFIDVTATAMQLRRTATDYGRDRLDMISLTLYLGTPIECRFGSPGLSGVVRPGQIGVKDFARSAVHLWQARPHRGLNLHLPRLGVEAALGDKAERLHGRVLSPVGLAPMLRSQLVAVARMAPRTSDTVRAAALDAAVDLAMSVLRCELGARLEDEANEDGLYAAAKLFISRHLGAQLNPGLIAQHLHCSRAHLYRVFAKHGETVAGHVREHRLRRAYSLLIARDGNAPSAVGDIAFRCGFEDPVHFSRLFRRHFGLTPRALKAGSRTSEE